MDNLREEKENLFRLFETLTEENIELAMQLMEGNKALKEAAEACYLPVLKYVLGREDMRYLGKLEPYVCLNCYEKDWTPSPEQLRLIKKLPIEELDGSYLEMDCIPEWICAIVQLQQLILNDNQISSIPEAIGQLVNLEKLSLEQNKITAIPDSIGNLKALLQLQLDFNQIKKIPDSIGNLSSLEWLCLEGNPIDSLPNTILNLKEIEWLSVENTPFGDARGITNGTYMDVDEIRDLLEKPI